MEAAQSAISGCECTAACAACSTWQLADLAQMVYAKYPKANSVKLDTLSCLRVEAAGQHRHTKQASKQVNLDAAVWCAEHERRDGLQAVESGSHDQAMLCNN